MDNEIPLIMSILRSEMIALINDSKATTFAYRPDYGTQSQHSYMPARSDISEIPFTNYYTIDNSGATPNVTFTDGEVIWGKASPIFPTNKGPHTITTTVYWGIRVTYSSGVISASWVSGSTEADFNDTDTSFAQWYYKFIVNVSGKAEISSVAAIGNWKIPSVFAPEI